MKSASVGLAPGTLLHEDQAHETQLRLLKLDGVTVQTKSIKKISELPQHFSKKDVLWLQFKGLADIDALTQLGELLDVPKLTLEDILNPHQRPKADAEDAFTFVCIKYPHWHGGMLKFVQVSIIVTPHVVVSFTPDKCDFFQPLEDRFHQAQVRLKKFGHSYLGYAIIDFVLDQSFPVQKYFEEKIEELAIQVQESPGKKVREELYQTRRNLLGFRKNILPLSEAMLILQKTNSLQPIHQYINDLRDHVLQLREMIRTYSETLDSLASLYFSITGEQTNRVMQVLTTITITFLPLTLIAGIYGMNFKNMPELSSPFGYYIVLGVMVFIAAGILLFFRKNKWL